MKQLPVVTNKLGYIIWKCDSCDFEGSGASVTIHELHNKFHHCIMKRVEK